MALLTSTSNVGGSLPDDFGALVVQPALALSVFAQVATTVTTGSTRYRIPIVTAEPQRHGWPRDRRFRRVTRRCRSWSSPRRRLPV